MIGEKFDALLRLKGSNMNVFAKHLGTSSQNFSGKRERNSFYFEEGIQLADYVGGKLVIIDDDGKILMEFDKSDVKKKK